MPDYDLHINPQMRKSAIQLLPPALSCDVEFGAGFLPPDLVKKIEANGHAFRDMD